MLDKPYVEIHAGKIVRKVSPRTRHSLVQGAMLVILRQCGRPEFQAGTEWDCDLTEVIGAKTMLVPDVAAFRKSRLDALTDAAYQCPPFAPDVVVEVQSPNDRPVERAWKIETYLKAGSALVLDVVPESRTIVAITLEGLTRFESMQHFSHPAAPWLEFDIVEAFADLDDRRLSG